MRQAGRYLPEYREVRARAGSFLDLCYSPKYAAEVALQPIRRFDLDAAILFSDILVIPDGLGQMTRFDEGVGPVLMRLEGIDDFSLLSLTRMENHLVPVYQTVADLRATLPPEVALIGFSGAPWTLATYMLEGKSSREFELAKYWAYARPEDFSRLVDILVEAVVLHLSQQIKAGAQALQIFDTWAGVLDGWGFRRWVEDPIRRIAARLKRDFPEVPILAFARGAGAQFDGLAQRLGVDGLSLDAAVPLAWGRDVVQKQTLIQGNLDPAILRIGGPAMDRAVRDILAAWQGGRFVFNLGHGILPDTPPQHVEALVRLVREGGRSDR
jgi:uroporphyrinogen decarboxylase